AKVVELARGGVYVDTACKACGIAEKTYYNWLERGKAGEEPYASFLQATAKAAAEAEVYAQTVVMSGRGNWQARAWWLERTRPTKYGRRDRIEHAGDPESPLARIVIELPSEDKR
ncbi:MAG TPA: hypothetical protein VFD36_25810, partial [Kofleriaceae bacterium]|nr:hypothetical protein [Kofleriaceae bacterium]